MKVTEKWKTLKTDIAFDNEWCTVHKDVVELPSGKIIDDYYVNIRPDVVLVFPITTDGKVIMVRQYKHGAKEILLEFPGGVFDPAEELASIAALRELREETGYFSSNMQELGVVYDNPTKDTNKIFFFLAHNAEKRHDTEFDVTEDIETVQIPINEIPALIKAQKIRVSGSIAIYFAASMALNL
jgi:8-oxo-dGTP pyrophosphatase MutT (NUDIX family)